MARPVPKRAAGAPQPAPKPQLIGADAHEHIHADELGLERLLFFSDADRRQYSRTRGPVCGV